MNLAKIIQFKIIAIVFCILVSAFTLSKYAILVQHLVKIKYNWQFELLMVLAMLIFQYPFLYKNNWHLKLGYYFNMLLVSLMGSVLLWPLILVNRFYHCSDYFNVLYFFEVVLLMFFEHKRIVASLQLPVFISYTWVLYRFIILIFIL